jgi:hypothetical protein
MPCRQLCRRSCTGRSAPGREVGGRGREGWREAGGRAGGCEQRALWHRLELAARPAHEGLLQAAAASCGTSRLQLPQATSTAPGKALHFQHTALQKRHRQQRPPSALTLRSAAVRSVSSCTPFFALSCTSWCSNRWWSSPMTTLPNMSRKRLQGWAGWAGAGSARAGQAACGLGCAWGTWARGGRPPGSSSGATLWLAQHGTGRAAAKAGVRAHAHL